ncbi:MAG: glycogen debranching N-terminal domain-containing protein [Angustibacter sp.]
MATAAQPFLHDLVTCFRAPTAVLSSADGQIRAHGAQGALHADVRVLSEAVLRVDGTLPEHLSTTPGRRSGDAHFTGVVRSMGAPGPDPTAVVERWRQVRPGAVEERLVLVNGADGEVTARVELDLAADHAGIDAVKAGRPVAEARLLRDGDDVRGWSGADVEVELAAGDAEVLVLADGSADGVVRVRLAWHVRLGARSRRELTWALRAHDHDAAVVAAPDRASWSTPTVAADDPRLGALLARSLSDLDGLRMVVAEHPDHVFTAAGSPWFFTLFGRDSLWAARMLLPLGTDLAGGTLRTLAAHQGRVSDHSTGEEPGKIPHELRRGHSTHDESYLPPLYYGTVDATPLWVVLLHDAWRWGLPDAEVRALLPALRAALTWVVEHGDTDGDGFLEYVDHSGQGLANQGWKDSGDAIRFADGTLAEGPVALCEVQGYAYEAAMSGAALLEAFGEPGAATLRTWAGALAQRFRERFWVGEGADRRPALALDGSKRPVDSVTSNIGHLLGTGILDDDESALVARRLGRADLRSGYGLRTMSEQDGGYWPLSYHCGSVWPHDTAIVVHGLLRDGHRDLASALVRDLLAASEHFDARLPELFGGRGAGDGLAPQPYPASCRPQAWSAAASVVMLQAVLGLTADVPGGGVQVQPCGSAPVGAVRVDGLRVGDREVSVHVDREGRLVRLGGLDDLDDPAESDELDEASA